MISARYPRQKSAVYMYAYTEFLTVVKDGISARQVKTVRNRYHECFFTLVSTHPLSLPSCCPLFFVTTRCLSLSESQFRSVTIRFSYIHQALYFLALKTLKENSLLLLWPKFHALQLIQRQAGATILLTPAPKHEAPDRREVV